METPSLHCLPMFRDDDNKTALAFILNPSPFFILNPSPLHTPSLGSSGVFVSQTMSPLTKANLSMADSAANNNIDLQSGTQLIDLQIGGCSLLASYAIMEKRVEQLLCFSNYHHGKNMRGRESLICAKNDCPRTAVSIRIARTVLGCTTAASITAAPSSAR